MLEYDDGGTDRPVIQGHKGLVRIFQAFIVHRGQMGNPIGDDWTSITVQEFDEFRVLPTTILVMTGNVANAASTALGNVDTA